MSAMSARTRSSKAYLSIEQVSVELATAARGPTGADGNPVGGTGTSAGFEAFEQFYQCSMLKKRFAIKIKITISS